VCVAGRTGSAAQAEQKRALANAYGDQAITLLKQSLKRKPGPDAESLKKDPNFAYSIPA
jgi:hypothetical protein